MKLCSHLRLMAVQLMVLSLLSCSSGGGEAVKNVVAAPNARLLESGDLTYAGAFRVPKGDYGSPTWHGLSYGGRALAYNPAHDSLFIVGHIDDQLAMELSIPQVVKSSVLSELKTADVLQPFADLTEGNRGKICAGGVPCNLNGNYIGGLLVHNEKLVGTVYGFYDGANQARLSHFLSGTNLSAAGDFAGMFQIGANTSQVPGAGFVAGYLGEIPAPYQEPLGGTVLTGQGLVPVVGRTSYGPAAFAFDPDALTGSSPVAATPLVYYPEGHQTLGTWGSGRQDRYVSVADLLSGVVFPAGSRSVLFFGRHGAGKSCYGPGTSIAAETVADPPVAGTTCGDMVWTSAEVSAGDHCCYDPTDGSKGTHAYPYQHFVWAYDVNDFIAVKAGAKKPWEIAPYAGWSLDGSLGAFGTAGQIYGAAYDAATQRLFISQGHGEDSYPIVHVFRINLSPP